MRPRSSKRLPPGTVVWVLASGKAGHEVQCFAVARALGVEPVVKLVRPRAFFAALAPWGPMDFRDAPGRACSAFAPPFPQIVIGAGRLTIPYLRGLKKASGHSVFTICLQDPRIGEAAADLIWVPEHDRLRGANVLATLTSPHGVGADALKAARAAPDERLIKLASPRAAMILGGPSAHHTYDAGDYEALAGIARQIIASGFSLMVSPSRRTPPQLAAAIGHGLRDAGAGDEKVFVWDGEGANPYTQMLAHSDAIVVTADSANMLGEAAATGVPVHVYEPGGGHPKMSAFLERLIASGAVRRWSGALERWSYTPIDATHDIAREAVRRYSAFASVRDGVSSSGATGG